MKKTLFVFVFFAAVALTSAQRLPIVGIVPFVISGPGVTPEDTTEATRLVIAELTSWGTMIILSGERALEGEYLVRGQLHRRNNILIIITSTSITGSGRSLNNSIEEAPELSGISIESLCTQIAMNIPIPNFLLGKWCSTIDMIDGPLTSVMEFTSNRTILVEQYDTWEHSGTNSLKYQAIGNGTYSYAGYIRRTVTIGDRTFQAEATVGLHLNLEDSLPRYTYVSAEGLRLLFSEAKDNFEIVYGGIPCGDNFTGRSVYPDENVFYTRFIKVQ